MKINKLLAFDHMTSQAREHLLSYLACPRTQTVDSVVFKHGNVTVVGKDRSAFCVRYIYSLDLFELNFYLNVNTPPLELGYFPKDGLIAFLKDMTFDD